ncbi:hypothetical protein [Neorhizobium alkalisoli]|uniref:hypothetical protein n=1 Tax=Neorhizobium alkalisoli TaxID=528178 RepID=UPI001FE157E8|nr:hypothetical protein [Neorhizobium alkalisoli]
MNTGFVTDGRPDHRFLEFYESRSSPELYCSIVGNVVVPNGHGSNASTPMITGDSIWAELAKGISDGGASPGIQLATTWAGYTGSRKFVTLAPNTVIAEGRELTASMGLQGIEKVIESFRAGAAMAVKHGFRHIQLHAAHGYLLSLLIDRRINPLADHVINELKLLAEWLNMEGVESSIRMSLKTGDNDFDKIGTVGFQDEIATLPFSFVDLSSGFYNVDKRLIYPARPEFIEARISESREVAIRNPNRKFIFSGRVQMNGWNDLPPNMHPGFCRDIIANPKFLRETERGCLSHNKCHYYSRGEAHLTCGQWTPR